ncbi:hypothetical protein KEM56_005503 [Ascosphaera pollenicola]|nr:hypothetical protein KEM56_005503 [Ascosphaera pollenicola]
MWTIVYSTALALLSLAASSSAFYIPGYSVRSYSDKESILLFANKIFSDHTHLQYAYYELPFVCPPKGLRLGNSPFTSGTSMSLNLGEVLRGDRIKVSDFDISMGQDIHCAPLCTHDIDRKTLRRTTQLISDGYVAEMILDNLPGATPLVTIDRKKKYYSAGFKLGYQDPTDKDPSGLLKTFLYNHYTFVIRWRKAPGKAGRDGKKMIVAFEVYTKSLEAGHRGENGCSLRGAASKMKPFELAIPLNISDEIRNHDGVSFIPRDDNVDDGAKLSIPYTYSVYFREDESIDWSRRWDMYFREKTKSNSGRALTILNSLAVVFSVTAAVLFIWRKAVRQGVLGVESARAGRSPRSRSPAKGLSDLSYDTPAAGESDGSARWRYLLGDVFRAPERIGLLPPLVGSGIQFLFMFFGLNMLNVLGVVKPGNRGGFVSVGTGLFVVAGLLSGYATGRLYRNFDGLSWRKNALNTALLFPGLMFSLFFVLNLYVWAQASSTAIPFGTLVALISLWLLIQLPLVYIGSYIGYLYVAPYNHPTRTSLIPREIPTPRWYQKSQLLLILSGVLPFYIARMELSVVFRCLVQDKSGYYDVFGYLSFIATILMFTIAGVTIITTYVQLNAEDHRWWWRSFYTGASSAAWIFTYCIWYYIYRAKIHGSVASEGLFG